MHMEDITLFDMMYVCAHMDRISGQADRISGQADRISGQADRIPGQADRIPGQADHSSRNVHFGHFQNPKKCVK